MSTFTQQEFQTQLWGKVKVYAEERLVQLMLQLKKELPFDKTQLIRGGIRECELILNLDKENPIVEE